MAFLKGRNERTVVMDKSKGEPVISVNSKERVREHSPTSNHHLTSSVSAAPAHLHLCD